MKKGKEIYELPDGWIEVEIKDISLKLNYGYTAKSTINNTGTKLLRITDIQENHVDWSTVPYCEIDEYDKPEYVLNKGDIVFARTGATVGKSYLIGDNIPHAVFASYLIRIQLSQYVDPKFVFYYFHSGEYWKQIGVKALGVGQPHVNANSLSKLKLRLPSKENQQLIVTKIESLFGELDQAEKGLQKAKQQLEIYKHALLKSAFEGRLTKNWRSDYNPPSVKNLLNQIDEERQSQYEQELIEWKDKVSKWNKGEINIKPTRPSKPIIPEKPNNSHLSRLWKLPKGWEWTQLGLISFITKLAGFEYSKYVRYEDEGDLFVVKAENVGTNGFKKTDFSKIKTTSIAHLKRSELKGGELLIVFVGSGTGNVAVVPEDRNYFLGPNVGMARPFSGINPKYIEYFFQSSLGKRILLVTAKAVAQPSLSMGTIRQSPIAITTLEEQDKIVDIIESKLTVLGNLEETINNNLAKVNVFRHSILKRAFTGKLVSQDTNDENAYELLKRIKKEKAEYIKAQKEFDKLKPKKKRQMEEKKTVLEILESSDKPIASKELWQKSIHHDDIEAFYDELKEIYHRLSEIKENTESFLTLKK
jgi:type I restriction enzyme, S subunit